jgi:hypothetical protein
MKRVCWAGHVAWMGEIRDAYRMVRKQRIRDHLENLGIDGSIILNVP